MNYRNTEIKIDQLVAYLNEDKINLCPAFQRGHVWAIGTRRKLLKNILVGKPIPAIFLYKEAEGAKYSYNILDGKQRIESLILYIGSDRADFKIPQWRRFFFEETHRKHGGFAADIGGVRKKFAAVDVDVVRDLREYAISSIEIALDEQTSLDEIISLFVDINQQGVPVSRFHIVKAMAKNDPLLRAVFKLVSVESRRGHDVFYKMMGNEFTFVLKRLQIVQGIKEANPRVDRVWEKLIEISLYAITKTHKKPVEILKGFMSGSKSGTYKLTRQHVTTMRRVFRVLRFYYRSTTVGGSRLATDQTHFYTLVTSLIGTNILDRYGEADLGQRLQEFAKLLDGQPTRNAKVGKALMHYLALSAKQTTDSQRRIDREKDFLSILDLL